MSKRILGFANWHRGRKHIHERRIVELMAADIAAQKVDQVVVTGDLVNISLEEEFHGARAWLETLGLPEEVTVVPGNHDTYVRMSWGKSIGIWHDYMSSNREGSDYARHNTPFPFVRIFGHVAVVGLSSGVPKPPLIAAGRLGAEQLAATASILEALGRDGFFRVVLIHHPPLPGQNRTRKALDDAAEMQDVLLAHGAELVLHGHNHTDMMRSIESAQGLGHVIGVPSASAGASGHRGPAQYNIYKVAPGSGDQGCEVIVRGFDPETNAFREVRTFSLSTAASASANTS